MSKNNLAFRDALSRTTVMNIPKGKEDRIPILTPPTKIAREVDNYNRAKKDKIDAENRMFSAGEEIIHYAKKIQDADGYNGDFHNSYQMEGTHKDSSIKVIFTNKFSINHDDETQIRRIVGRRFDDLFEIKHSVILREEVFKEPELQEELMKRMGGRFAAFFTAVAELKVRKGFSKNIYTWLKPRVLQNLRIYVRQARPSLKD